MEKELEFKKSSLMSIMSGKTPMWSGIEIEEIDFTSLTPSGKTITVRLESGQSVNVEVEDIKFR